MVFIKFDLNSLFLEKSYFYEIGGGFVREGLELFTLKWTEPRFKVELG